MFLFVLVIDQQSMFSYSMFSVFLVCEVTFALIEIAARRGSISRDETKNQPPILKSLSE
jgi:hypothetical protein